MALCVQKKKNTHKGKIYVIHVVEIILSSKYISTDSFSGWNSTTKYLCDFLKMTMNIKNTLNGTTENCLLRLIWITRRCGCVPILI